MDHWDKEYTVALSLIAADYVLCQKAVIVLSHGKEMATKYGNFSNSFHEGIASESGIASTNSHFNLASFSGLLSKWNVGTVSAFPVISDPAHTTKTPSCESRLTVFSFGGRSLLKSSWNTVGWLFSNFWSSYFSFISSTTCASMDLPLVRSFSHDFLEQLSPDLGFCQRGRHLGI